VLHLLNRIRRVGGMTDHGSVDRGGRHAGSAGKSDAGRDQHS
jgi:hypothetical protein